MEAWKNHSERSFGSNGRGEWYPSLALAVQGGIIWLLDPRSNKMGDVGKNAGVLRLPVMIGGTAVTFCYDDAGR